LKEIHVGDVPIDNIEQKLSRNASEMMKLEFIKKVEMN
jgi:hypothetical protein